MYHINDKDESKRCSAKSMERCRFYRADDPRHYETAEEAQQAAEERIRKKALKEGHGTTNSLSKRTMNEHDDKDINFAGMERDERTRQMQETLDREVEQLIKDGRLAKFLDAMSKNGVQRWSANNILLAALQLRSYRKRNGLPVTNNLFDTINELDACGAKQWNERGRKVISGKGSALYILAPLQRKYPVKDAQGNQLMDENGQPVMQRYTYGWRSVAVFDVSQTEGEPVPQNPLQMKPVTTKIKSQYVDDMKNVVQSYGYKVVHAETASDPERLKGTLGATNPTTKEVTIDPRLSEAQQAAVLAHELGHIAMGHLDEDMQEYVKHRGIKETEAEALGYMLLQRAGLGPKEGAAFSAPYVAGWSKGDMSMVRTALNKVTSRFGKLMDILKWD